MPLIPLACPFCNGNAQIDSDKDIAKCPFCEREFVVRDAIVNNYVTNVTNNVTNINAETVNVYAEKDFVIEAGVLKKYQGENVDVVIPDNVLEIGDRAFFGMAIHSVVIPNSVTSIGESAFEGCVNLNNVMIPDSVTSFGLDAFLGCTSLTSITNIPLGSVTDLCFNTPFRNKVLQKQWKNKGLCPYCGGQFAGLFTKKCVKCGKPKDY